MLMTTARRTITATVAMGAALALLAPLAVASAVAGPNPNPGAFEVIATGLNNPRGVALGDHDTVYVAEAGLGAGNAIDGAVIGIGQTGSITRVKHAGSASPTVKRVVTGLWSTAGAQGLSIQTLGLDGIAVKGHHEIVGIMGKSNVAGTNLGSLVRIHGNKSRNLADVGAFDYAWTETYQNEAWASAPYSNPYAVALVGKKTYVVDAGANTVDEVLNNGTVRVIARLSDQGTRNAAPTCIAVGPDRALYVGEYKYGSSASVWRIDPKATNPDDLDTVLNVATVWATGFKTITGCAFDKQGTFYASQYAEGNIQTAAFADPTTGRTLIGVGELDKPQGIAVANDGTIYVADRGDSQLAGQGRLVRIRR